MTLKSIIIEFELDKDDLPSHTRVIHFEYQMWQPMGPTYPRINYMMKEVFDIIKERIKR